MIILKPEDPPSDKECVPPATLPSHVREFGKLPNEEKWLPGDLILVSSTKPDFIQRAIKEVQTRKVKKPRRLELYTLTQNDMTWFQAYTA